MPLLVCTLIPSNGWQAQSAVRPALLIVVCGILLLLQACSTTVVQQANKKPIKHPQALSSSCFAEVKQAIDATSQHNHDSALHTLLRSKNNGCVTQFELASVDQLLSSTYLLLDDYDNALNHLALAVDRDVLDAGLQKKSLYKAAQISYLLHKYQAALTYMTRYQTDVAELQPNEHVFMARCLYAIDRREEAFSIMIDLYAKHRSGKIVMKKEWIDFLRGMQPNNEASVS